FGALIHSQTAQMALDIGSGTGLLSLMVAQKHPSLLIDAVEIDSGASADARLNFHQSPYRDRLTLHESSIQNFNPATTGGYDLIFSNPPFYKNQLKSPDDARNLAHHSSGLSFQELAAAVVRLLNPSGKFWALLPPFEMADFIKEAALHSLFVTERFYIRHHTGKPAFREVIAFSFSPDIYVAEQEIIIYENDKYSSIFATLLRDYYLIF
ncbi:MAG TPA: methyltransferase, partial [Cyclobacteriaceae bacterium]|nr:methyltransferase [Cyclobacteriaceae bacterium]